MLMLLCVCCCFDQDAQANFICYDEVVADKHEGRLPATSHHHKGFRPARQCPQLSQASAELQRCTRVTVVKSAWQLGASSTAAAAAAGGIIGCRCMLLLAQNINL
jgi:hypothetical protein